MCVCVQSAQIVRRIIWYFVILATLYERFDLIQSNWFTLKAWAKWKLSSLWSLEANTIFLSILWAPHLQSSSLVLFSFFSSILSSAHSQSLARAFIQFGTTNNRMKRMMVAYIVRTPIRCESIRSLFFISDGTMNELLKSDVAAGGGCWCCFCPSISMHFTFYENQSFHSYCIYHMFSNNWKVLYWLRQTDSALFS